MEDDTVQEWDHDEACTSGALCYNPQTKVDSRRLTVLALHCDRSNQTTYDLMMHLRKSDTERLHLSKTQGTHNVIHNGSPDQKIYNDKWNLINHPKWNPINNVKNNAKLI